jgi:hypothetical protein
MSTIIDQAKEALKEQQAEQHMYEYSEVEKAVWINGYARGVIESIRECFKGYKNATRAINQPEPSAEDLSVDFPEKIDSRFQ